MKSIEKSLLMSDIHFNVADEPLVDLIAFRFGRWYKPHNIFLNGDIVDFYTISKYGKDPAYKGRSVEDDVNRTRKFLKDLRKAFPKANIYYIGGNHGYRISTYLAQNAPELYPYVNLGKILGLEELGIKFISSPYRENSMKFHDMIIGHFDRVKTDAGQTAMALMKERGISPVQGHVHRAGLVARTMMDGSSQIGVENPCLAKTPADYAAFTNWQKGATVLETYEGTTFPHILLVRPIGRKRGFVYAGKAFTV